jgi:hypothetical protein
MSPLSSAGLDGRHGSNRYSLRLLDYRGKWVFAGNGVSLDAGGTTTLTLGYFGRTRAVDNELG